MKRVQVNETLIQSAQALIDGLNTYGWCHHTQTLSKALQDELNDKYEANKRRKLYSTYKDSNSSKETKEIARQMYLDSVGMHKDWRQEPE